MKKSVLRAVLTGLLDAALVALATLAVPCAVMTAYRIEFALGPLIAAAVLIGICLSVWMHLPKLGFIAGILYFAVLTPLLLWNIATVRYGFELFRYSMLDLLAPDVPFLSEPTAIDPSVARGLSPVAAIGWFAVLVMAVLGLFIAWSLIRSKMIFLPLTVPLPIFMLSLIYTDLPIAHWTVLLLLLYLGTVLITGSLRVNDAPKYGSVALVMLAALLLLAAIVYTASPPESYEPITFEQRQQMIGERVQRIYDDVTNLMNNRVKRTEDLSDEDAWRRTNDLILEVRTETGGELYLRAYSLGGYGDNAWNSVPTYRGTWQSMPVLGNQTNGAMQSVSVRAESSEMLYVPYKFRNANVLEFGEAYLPARGLTEYEWTVASGTPTASEGSDDEAAYLAWAQETYRIEDEATKDALLRFCKSVGLLRQQSDYETAKAVAAYVKSICTYSTTPGRIPSGENFVLYFLTEGQKGYCVHFASATTAILQAMGIPARYVFGYRCMTTAGEWENVTDDMAHAWTEVYCAGIGWLPIESTPGNEEHAQNSPTETPETAAGTDAPTATPTPPPTPEPTSSQADNPIGANEPDETPAPTEVPTDAPKEAPRSTENPNGEGMPDGELPNLWRLLWLLALPAIIGGWIGAGALLRKRREKLFRQSDARSAVLAMYRYQKRLERFGAPKSEEAERLAEEATFSNHRMKKERSVMRAIVSHSVTALADAPAWKRLIRKFLLLLW